jgi:hypothetical protein
MLDLQGKWIIFKQIYSLKSCPNYTITVLESKNEAVLAFTHQFAKTYPPEKI